MRRAHISIPKGANGAIYPSQLSLHKQLLLKSILDALEATDNPFLSFNKAYSCYSVACEQNKRNAEDESTISSYLKDLSMDGYVLLTRREGERFVGMEYPFEMLAEVLEQTLKQALRPSRKH